MENVRLFYNEVNIHILNYIKDNVPNKEDKYPIIDNFDWNRTLSFIDKIANKLLGISTKDRSIYSRLIINALDLSYLPGIISYQVEEIENDTIFVFELKKHKYDIGTILSDCEDFVAMMWQTFIDFGIDIREEIKEMNLQNDYSFLDSYGIGDGFKPITKQANIVRKKGDSLTQDQLVLLFELLRDKKAIHPKASNTQLGQCIMALGMFSGKEGARQSFAKSKLDLIRNNTTNKNEVKIILQQIIETLDKE